MKIEIHPHAQQRMEERGAFEEEVRITVEQGEQFHAKYERMGFRRNFRYNDYWREKYFSTKQVEVLAVNESNKWVVISVITKYF